MPERDENQACVAQGIAEKQVKGGRLFARQRNARSCERQIGAIVTY
jgi:hypothetical protein